MDSAAHQGATLRDTIGVLRRRWYLAALAIVVAPAAAYAFAQHQPPRYSATAEVLLNQQDLASGITGVSMNPGSTPDRVAQTQAAVAATPAVAARVLRSLGMNDRTPTALLGQTTIGSKPGTDILTLTVADRSSAVAVRLATAYARQFISYQRKLDTAAIVSARDGIRQRLHALRRGGQTSSTTYQSLLDRDQQLATLQALESSDFVIRTADGAVKIAPRPVRNVALGLALGLVLGLGLVFLREAMDTRVRTAEEITHRLHLPLLARVPSPRRKLRARDSLAMVHEPVGTQGEPYRMLRTNLEFTMLDRGIRTLVVSSAVEREGKSTTAANLAVALARSGRRIVLVDLDLRRPYVDRFFGLDRNVGLTSVVLGQVELDDALVPISLEPDLSPKRFHRGARSRAADDAARDALEPREGSLEVLPSGTLPLDPGEFVGRRSLQQLLGRLADRADLVVLDTAPLLSVGDTMTLSAHVDGLLLVCRANTIRRPMLVELHRLLRTTPATAVGFVLTNADEEDAYSYSYGYYGAPERAARGDMFNSRW